MTTQTDWSYKCMSDSGLLNFIHTKVGAAAMAAI